MNCIMCPSRLWRDKQAQIEMEFEVFEELSKYFKHTKLVYLQGWGEPLQHERIFEMIEIAKETSEVGFTTNGMLLNEKTNKKILELDVDYMAISMAGASKEMHESIRKGTNFSKIIKNVKNLLSLRNGKPKIIFTFLMNRMNIEELPKIVELAAELKIDEVVATNLDYVFDDITDKLKIFSCEKPEKNHVNLIKKAKKVADKRKIKLRLHPLHIEEVVICDALPTKSLTVSAEGKLYPCVYLGLPFKKIPRIFCGEYVEVEKPDFGSVDDFWGSWNSKNYVEFRKMYEKRIKEYDKILDNAFLTPFDIRSKIKETFSKNPIPEVCKTCYKAYGV